jgi:pyruvate/2-oxoglutarate dehydrogenase complex dihydrolipoamide dehydrogenase (E3) component
MTKKISADICIIGAGSGGLSVAAGAAQLGKKVVLLEKGKMGGDCLNYGCVPSKALLAAGKTAQVMRDAEKYGVQPVAPTVDFQAVHDHVHSVIAAIEPNDSVERFEGFGVNVIQEAGRFIGPREVQAGDTVIKAKHFVVATGSSPFVPPIKGIETVPYLTNEIIFDRTELPSHLLIIGGGPIGLEMAQAHRRLGAEVTVVEGATTILPKDDPELAEIAIENLRKEGINIITGAMVEELAGSEGNINLAYVKDGETHMVTGSHLLVATGRKANIDGLDLEKAGVQTDGRSITVDDRLRTTNKRVYAAGDVTGGRQFTHVAGYHAGIIVQNMLFKMPAKNKEHNAPWVTYIDPELAHVGLNEAMAKEQGVNYTVAKWDFEENDRAQAEHATHGLIKVLVGKKGKVLGASIVGKNAGDLIGPWALAVANGLKIRAFTNMIAPYPTLGEVSKRAAGAYYTPSLFSSKTRSLIKFLSIFD